MEEMYNSDLSDRVDTVLKQQDITLEYLSKLVKVAKENNLTCTVQPEELVHLEGYISDMVRACSTSHALAKAVHEHFAPLDSAAKEAKREAEAAAEKEKEKETKKSTKTKRKTKAKKKTKESSVLTDTANSTSSANATPAASNDKPVLDPKLFFDFSQFANN